MTTRNFAITGVGGFVAPRHLQAIRDTGHRVVAAVDPNDSVLRRVQPSGSELLSQERLVTSRFHCLDRVVR